MDELQEFSTNKNVSIDFRSVWRDGKRELYITMTIEDISMQDICYLEFANRSDLHKILATLKEDIDYRLRKRKKNMPYNRRDPN